MNDNHNKRERQHLQQQQLSPKRETAAVSTTMTTKRRDSSSDMIMATKRRDIGSKDVDNNNQRER